MKTIKVEKEELKSTIEMIADRFGTHESAIYVRTDGALDIRNSSESMEDWHLLLTVSGLGEFVDESDNYPDSPDYDSSAVADYIISEGLYESSIDVDGCDYKIEVY